MNKVSAARRLPGRVLRICAAALVHALLVLALLWASLSLHFSDLLPPTYRWIFAIVFFLFGIWALWLSSSRNSKLMFAVAFAVVLAMWTSIRPSHDREWRAEVAVMPRALIEGDRVLISGVRNFMYTTTDAFTPRHENREVHISHLTGIDLYVSYWMPGPVAHTFVSFVFDNAPPLSISIEARPEADEGYSPLGSLFKEFELIYVVGDERDLVRVRSNFRGEEVFLYRIRGSPEVARRLFVLYLDRINDLADRPEFYHLLSNSCTVNIVRYASAAYNPLAFDIRHYLNGWFDRFLYQSDRVDTSMPFAQLRERAHINDLAREAAHDSSFSERIRQRLSTQTTPSEVPRAIQ
jgi:hypothetical protein